MEYILVMALSGTVMTVLYLLTHHILKEKISARAYYLLARAAVLYYLIPLPFLKLWYQEAILALLPKSGSAVIMAAQLPMTWTKYTVRAEGKVYANIFAWIQVAIIAIWVAGAGVVIAKRLMEYMQIVHRFAAYAELEMTDRHREVIDDFRVKFGVKRRVALYYEQGDGRTMTFGVIRPVIICSKEPGSPEAELLLRHEMVHIKRLDVVWKALLQFASFIHWWNPILWRLDRSFERDCECSCDEAAMAGRSKEDVTMYLKLLVEEATREQEAPETAGQWNAGFSENAQKIEERVKNLMTGKKRNRLAAGALVAVLIFANSMTVFAYRDTVHMEVTTQEPQEEIEKAVGVKDIEFIFDEADAEIMEDFEALEGPIEEILYDKQFTDEDGNIYPAEDEGIEPQHEHTYGTGTFSEHYVYSDGSCEVRVYDGQRCTKCGYILRGALQSVHNYVKCPH